MNYMIWWRNRVELFLGLIIFLSQNENDTVDPEINMDAPELIRFNGYKPEVHHVTTDDGFIIGYSLSKILNNFYRSNWGK